MVQRLEPDKQNPNRPRRELDQKLQVNTWRLPGGAYRHRKVAPNTPIWWKGDEDASQTFLHAMGVVNVQ
jgi:hypothetical protein